MTNIQLKPHIVSPPVIIPLVDFTGQITVVTAGVIVPGPDVSSLGGFRLKAHVDNTDTVWVFTGADKTVGYPLNAGQEVYVPVINLINLKFDADVNNSRICYMKA